MHTLTRPAPLAAALVALAAAVAAPSSRAAADPSSQAAAEQLFRDGKQAMKDGRIAEACAAFEASEKAEHNVATVMNLADCREKNHELAAAWALFLRVDGETRGDATFARLGEVARQRAAALEPHLSHLVINVPEDHVVVGLEVSRDGVAVEAVAWNRAIPIDGGTHTVAAHAPGHEPWSTSVTIAASDDTASVEVPRFSDLPPLVPATPPTPPPAHGATPPAPAPTRPVALPPPTPEGVPTSPLVTGAIVTGAAFLLGSAVAWEHASTLHRDADALCPTDSCTPDGADAANRTQLAARRWGLVSDIGIGVGSAAIAASVLLWMRDRDAHDHTALRVVPQLGDGAGLALTGGF